MPFVLAPVHLYQDTPFKTGGYSNVLPISFKKDCTPSCKFEARLWRKKKKWFIVVQVCKIFSIRISQCRNLKECRLCMLNCVSEKPSL